MCSLERVFIQKVMRMNIPKPLRLFIVNTLQLAGLFNTCSLAVQSKLNIIVTFLEVYGNVGLRIQDNVTDIKTPYIQLFLY